MKEEFDSPRDRQKRVSYSGNTSDFQSDARSSILLTRSISWINYCMKTYYFWVTLEGKGPMKVAEDGRTASEAKSIVEARFPGARVMFAEGF